MVLQPACVIGSWKGNQVVLRCAWDMMDGVPAGEGWRGFCYLRVLRVWGFCYLWHICLFSFKKAPDFSVRRFRGFRIFIEFIFMHPLSFFRLSKISYLWLFCSTSALDCDNKLPRIIAYELSLVHLWKKWSDCAINDRITFPLQLFRQLSSCICNANVGAIRSYWTCWVRRDDAGEARYLAEAGWCWQGEMRWVRRGIVQSEQAPQTLIIFPFAARTPQS